MEFLKEIMMHCLNLCQMLKIILLSLLTTYENPKKVY